MKVRPEGQPVGARELLHLGNRAAIDQTLSRLHRHGALMRIGRGLYVSPIQGRFGIRAPSPGKVVEAIATVTGETVASHGAAAGKVIGLLRKRLAATELTAIINARPRLPTWMAETVSPLVSHG